MAKQAASSSSGDWTAGIVAIFAAFLLAGAIPIALYYALYTPRVKEREAEEVKFKGLQEEEKALIAKAERVLKLEQDGETMKARLAKVEEKFTQPADVQELIARLTKLTEAHNIRLKAEQANVLRAKIVYDGERQITFGKGLKASAIKVDGQGTFHDIGRFIADIESAEDAVILVESLDLQGDQNGAYSHNFSMTLYAVERRDLEAVGR